MRALVREHSLRCDDLIWPLFIGDDTTSPPIEALPGLHCHGPDDLLAQAETAMQLGIPAIALFPRVADGDKDAGGRAAFDERNLVCRSLRAVKKRFPDLGLIADVALDPYTDHGHDGVLDADGLVDNDRTVAALVRQAGVLADAGADVLAPSDMMDGRVGALRRHFEDAGMPWVHIMAYSAKYDSAFYGPFRQALGSRQAPGGADIRHVVGGGKADYQMDPGNAREALREAELDVAEGADSLIVKPGGPCLDVIWRLSSAVRIPVLGYQVSGEYAMLCAAAARGAFDREAAMMESLVAFKRAGARAIWTYFAPQAARVLA